MSNTSETDFTIIINNCINGKRKSQKELYDLISGEMFAICVANSQNMRDAEDVLAEGFIKVLNNIDKYAPSVTFKEWCTPIFIKTAHDYYLNKNSNHNYC